MADFNAAILADGGHWTETEVLGDRAIVKVRASAATLTTIAGTATFRRIPLDLLDDSLASLTNGQRNAIKNELLSAGYTNAEINAAVPDLSAVTLRQVLHFFASRRKKPRPSAGTFVFDGPEVTPRAIEEVDGEVV
jgi:hypothetical protein